LFVLPVRASFPRILFKEFVMPSDKVVVAKRIGVSSSSELIRLTIEGSTSDT
jgi:hypothetical protein